MGDPVKMINFSKHAKDNWLAGVVTDKHGPLTYLITLDDGRIYTEDILTILYMFTTNCMTNIGTQQTPLIIALLPEKCLDLYSL